MIGFIFSSNQNTLALLTHETNVFKWPKADIWLFWILTTFGIPGNSNGSCNL